MNYVPKSILVIKPISLAAVDTNLYLIHVSCCECTGENEAKVLVYKSYHKGCICSCLLME